MTLLYSYLLKTCICEIAECVSREATWVDGYMFEPTDLVGILKHYLCVDGGGVVVYSDFSQSSEGHTYILPIFWGGHPYFVGENWKASIATMFSEQILNNYLFSLYL